MSAVFSLLLHHLVSPRLLLFWSWQLKWDLFCSEESFYLSTRPLSSSSSILEITEEKGFPGFLSFHLRACKVSPLQISKGSSLVSSNLVSSSVLLSSPACFGNDRGGHFSLGSSSPLPISPRPPLFHPFIKKHRGSSVASYFTSSSPGILCFLFLY